MDISLPRFFIKPTVADYMDWLKRHEVKPPSAPIQEKLKQTSGFADTKPWRVRFHKKELK
jgi:hypothetical protein